MSRDTKQFANAVYRRLRDGGRVVYPVNPTADGKPVTESFLLWFVVMAVQVLGHLLDTAQARSRGLLLAHPQAGRRVRRPPNGP